MTATVPQQAQEARSQGGITGIEEALDVVQMNPEDIAPFAAYLASDHAANINGQTFLVYGNTVSLFAQPRLINTIYKDEGIWSVEELRELMPKVVVKGVTNPAPPQLPRN